MIGSEFQGMPEIRKESWTRLALGSTLKLVPQRWHVQSTQVILQIPRTRGLIDRHDWSVILMQIVAVLILRHNNKVINSIHVPAWKLDVELLNAMWSKMMRSKILLIHALELIRSSVRWRGAARHTATAAAPRSKTCCGNLECRIRHFSAACAVAVHFLRPGGPATSMCRISMMHRLASVAWNSNTLSCGNCQNGVPSSIHRGEVKVLTWMLDDL